MTNTINLNQQASRFGTHPMFDIDGLDWLCQHLTATPAKVFDDFNTPVKSDNDYSGWQERCACIGTMPTPARALCSLLVWGMDKANYETVQDHLAGVVLTELKKAPLPKNCPHNRQDLSHKMATMVLMLHLQNAWDLCTVKGRLYFFSIDINEKTYTNQFTKHQRLLIDTLQELAWEIDGAIVKYRNELKDRE
ncbi:hypothetical protein LU276_08210 [Moraxella haemolytica]|uniref:hypothetical protein n=1 Tax=Moraxella haemolytica TaxID=2904119 RepID=UPI002542B1E4|nr:hypothetical protein [Moraxella sp. ZY171148]WII94983.1 hypothetical protein LU276_08210 [Moraxella sp. ZY171148]